MLIVYAALEYINIIRNERLLFVLLNTLLIKCNYGCCAYNLLLLEYRENRTSEEAPTKIRPRAESNPPPPRRPELNASLATLLRTCDIKNIYNIINCTCIADETNYAFCNKISQASISTAQDLCRAVPNSASISKWSDLK